jgi:PhnB protein
MAKSIPEGYHSLTPQLSLEDAAAAIAFFKEAFGAEELDRAPDPSGKKIWHASLKIGSSILFVNDVFPDMGGSKQTASLWLYQDNVDAGWKRATQAGCTVVMPLGDQFWGDRLGTLADRFGNRWTLAQRIKDMTPAEMKAAGDAFIAAMKK